MLSMHDDHESILFFDDLTPAQQEALRRAFAQDPALAETYAQWEQVRAAVRRSLHAHIPNRRVFVLYALEASGHGEVLSDEDRQTLATARSRLDEAVEAHPALADVIGQCGAACDDFEAAWAQHFEAEARVVPAAAPRQPARSSRPVRSVMRWSWRVAAVVAVVAFGAVLALVLQRDRGLTTVTVAEGAVELVELADGSTVRLLGGSTLTYAAPAQATAFNRRVALTGRAFFDIVRDRQGFTVETPTALTTVLGTTFGIQAEEAVMEVVLATGSLSVASKEAREQVVVLQPGQMSRVVRNALPSAPAPVDVAEALEWTGLFLFQATPLGEAAARLSERYGVRVTVAPSLTAEGVTGTFAGEASLTQILNTLAATLDAVVQGNETDGYTIAPKP